MVLPKWASDKCFEKASQDRQTLLLQRMSAGTSARDSPSRGKTHTPFFPVLNSFATYCLCYWLLRWPDIFPRALCQVSEEVSILPNALEAPGPDSDIRVRFAHISEYSQGKTRWHRETKTKQWHTRHSPKSHSIIKTQDRARSYRSVWFDSLYDA